MSRDENIAFSPDVTLSDLLTLGRRIWGDDYREDIQGAALILCKVSGDLAGLARDARAGQWDRDGACRELGNLVLSAVRLADDLGLTMGECLTAAAQAQRRKAAERSDR
jgi:hypothetical protein